MKVHIDNRTKLPMKIIGEVFDHFTSDAEITTNYVGKLWNLGFKCWDTNYRMQILIKKSCTVVVVVAV